MIDQEQTTDTTNDAPTNSEAETNPSEKSSEQDTSTTVEKTDEEKIDLGKGDEGGNEVDDQKTEDTRTDEEKAADAERAALFGAPEGDAPYEISGLPEGMAIDTAAVEALTPLARKLNLSNEGFSAIAQTYATEVLPGVTKTIVDSLQNDVVETRKGWETDARNTIAGKGDKLETVSGEPIDFGGKALPEVQKTAAQALDKFAPVGFRAWLDETGLGVHPQMIAFAYNVAQKTAEDREVETSEVGSKKPAPAGGGRPMSEPSKFYDRG